MHHMPKEEQIQRLNTLRSQIKRNNVFTWVEHYLKTLSGMNDRGKDKYLPPQEAGTKE